MRNHGNDKGTRGSAAFALFMAVALGAATHQAFAQAPPAGGALQTQPAQPAAKKKATAKPGPTAAKPAATLKPAAKKVAATTKKSPAKSKAKKAGGVPPEFVRPKLSTTVGTGMRDPFKMPTAAEQSGPSLPNSPGGPGTRGLIIGDLRLEGIVRQDTTNQMIAVVAGASNRAYFLRENDRVYNGAVAKIDLDSVMFREDFVDPSGKISSREVTKRMPGSGEKR